MSRFTLEATAPDTHARAGVLLTERGAIETPVFMPVGTRGTVRTQTLAQLGELDARIVLANTYHLLVRPGPALFERFGGLHRWMRWDRAILTDSGGYQLFSLGASVTEDGAVVRDPNGATTLLDPERAIAMQRTLGSDVMMVLDHCIAATASRAETEAAMARTHRWAQRSQVAFRAAEPRGQLFGIVQGGCEEDLRRASADAIVTLGFDGYAIGGLAVGETRAQREDLTELVTNLLPTDHPRYLMGVGTPLDLLEAVHRGVDMFDCILPTAWAQQGNAFTSRGRVVLRRTVYELAEAPLDPACRCTACATYSRSYLHHLVKSREPLGWQLLAFHNLAFVLRLVREMRAHIRAGTFAAYRASVRDQLAAADLDHPPAPQPRRRRWPPRSRGAFELVRSPAGFTSIRHVASGEIMHSVNEPDVEAERVYIAQSALLANALAGVRDTPPIHRAAGDRGDAQSRGTRTTGSDTLERGAYSSEGIAGEAGACDVHGEDERIGALETRPLVVWDVGLGAAHNAMALVRALERAGTHGHVTLISFERDRDAFALALANGAAFPHLRHAAPHTLAHAGVYRRGNFTWARVDGDFLATLGAQPPPDVVFYDPFSSAVDTELWTLATLTRVFAACSAPAELFTYTSSTAIRSSFLAAGFSVARGVPSGPKQETTIALKAFRGPHTLLGREWLDRRARSTAPIAGDIAPDQRVAVDQLVRNHAQFR